MVGMTEKHELQTPGEILSAARKQQSLTLDQVAERTKIPVTMIAAVEADEYFKISGPIYVRSFLRTIAQALGVDSEHVLDLHRRLAGQVDGTKSGDAPVWETEEVVVQRVGFNFRPWMLYVVVGLAVAVLALLLARGCRDSRSVANPDDSGQRNSTDPQTVVVDTLESANSAAVDIPTVDQEKPQSSSADLPACYSAGEPVVFSGNEDYALVLVVATDHVLSVQVRSDGQRDFHGADWGDVDGIPLLPAGEVVPGQVYRCRDGFLVFWGAADHFGMKLGDLSGVSTYLQGRPYGLSGLTPGQEIILDRHSVGN